MASYRRASLVAIAAVAAIAGGAGIASATSLSAPHAASNDDGGYCGQSQYYDNFHHKNRSYHKHGFCDHGGRTGSGSPLDKGLGKAFTDGNTGNYHEH